MAAHADLMKHISENQNHFKRALEIHGHLQQAKNILTGVMAKNSEFGHSINGEATGPEGAVAVDKNGNMSKFVDRNEFSRQNLLGAGRFQKQPVTEGYLLEAIMPNHVTTFMRANPPTAGHAKVVDKVLDIAKDTGGSHSVVLSHSQDPSKNPLSPTQKLKHARNAFPNANIQTSSEEAPSLLHHAVSLHNQGVKNLHLVVGQDRVGQFEKLLNNYNGKESKHGYYNFDSINVHSAGDRDPDAEGVEGVSGTMMRKAAKSGDRNTFHSGSSAAMSEKHRDDMMKDVVSGMSIKEESGYVPNEGNAASAASLSASGAPQESGPLKKKKLKEDEESNSEYWKKNPRPETPVDRFMQNYAPVISQTKAAVDAVDNVKKGNYKDAALGILSQVPKVGIAAGVAKALVRENTTGSVGGLGFNTGNPAADDKAMQQYLNTNDSLAKDDENGNNIKAHNDLHAPIGFKEFDPKKDLKK
jgi:hypothetical protein